MSLKKVSRSTQGIFNIIPKEFRISMAIIGGGYLAYSIYKKMNPSEEEKQAEQLETEASSVKDPKTGKSVSCKQNLSYAPSQYQSWANTLYDAFFAGFGTDEETVFVIINKLKNECDLRQLISDFGLRRQEFRFSEYDLPWFMRDELDKDELSYVNRILSTKGINYQF